MRPYIYIYIYTSYVSMTVYISDGYVYIYVQQTHAMTIHDMAVHTKIAHSVY